MDKETKEWIRGLLKDVYKAEVEKGSDELETSLKVKDYALGMIGMLMDNVYKPAERLEAIKIVLDYEKVIQGWLSR